MTTFQRDGMLVPAKIWDGDGRVPMDLDVLEQAREIAMLPFVVDRVVLLPDAHVGIGGPIGTAVPTKGALVPSITGVDLGCGMCAVRTNLTSSSLGDRGQSLRDAIERTVPHGRTDDGGRNDRGAWQDVPGLVADAWNLMSGEFDRLAEQRPRLDTKRQTHQLGTLGTGNHFIEVCLDEEDHVWVMLHSGSRGIGNRIGSTFIALAKDRCAKDGIKLPNSDLAWLPDDVPEFGEYVRAVSWAQGYAYRNRAVMMALVLSELRTLFPEVQTDLMGVSCHHNYVAREKHFGEDLWITRKGAVSARLGELGIIPGAMGRKSFIVRGRGNADSFHTCSHGAGRSMSRGEARRTITLEQHTKDTESVLCRKDEGVLDESPAAYKQIDDVMAAQADLVEVVHVLKAVVCVKG
jgi:tRNA-splicing ligase RtcB (3'-phosphate/5'-hydroxy nucleic acid ligase)